LIVSSIIIINGVFLCSNISYGRKDFQNFASQDLEVPKLQHSIKTILKEPRFTYHERFGWFKTLIKKISRLVQLKPLPKIPPLRFNSKFLTIGFKILGMVVLILIPFGAAFFMNRFWQRDWRVKNKLNQAIGRAYNSASLKRTALSMAETGQYREGIRYLYLAGLEKLKEENLLAQAAKFSDQENLKSLRKLLGEGNKGYVAFYDLTMVFQEKWYGLKDCRVSDYRLAENKLEIVYAIKTTMPA
jgi:hypothetical protein